MSTSKQTQQMQDVQIGCFIHMNFTYIQESGELRHDETDETVSQYRARIIAKKKAEAKAAS